MKLKRKHNAPNKVHFFYYPLLSFFLSPLEILCLGIILRASSSIKKCEVVFTVANLKRPLFRNNFYDPSFFFFSNNSSNNFSSALLRWPKEKTRVILLSKNGSDQSATKTPGEGQKSTAASRLLKTIHWTATLTPGRAFQAALKKTWSSPLAIQF